MRYLAALIVLVTLQCRAQHNFGVKYFGFSMHPKGDEQAHLMPYKLDKKARYIVNFGAIVSWQKFIYREFVSVKFAQGFYTDSGGLPSGHTHIGLRISVIDDGKNNLLFGFGPTLIYRRHWNIKEGYVSTGIFREHGNIQYKGVLYGGEIEYNRYISEHFDISAHFLPGYPLVMSMGAGVRWWPKGR